jgi:hypothetical protein
MEFVCRRCEQITKQRPYRVTTKDEDRVLLNMLVCPSCARLAKSLGLATVKIEWAERAAKTKGVQPTTEIEQQAIPARASIPGAALRLSDNSAYQPSAIRQQALQDVQGVQIAGDTQKDIQLDATARRITQ